MTYKDMNIEKCGKLYTSVMAAYFIVSGLNALMDVDAKLQRIGLSAVDSDGKIAFILIYCSLMIGVGAAIILISHISRTWIYSAILATTVVFSFVCFRVVGSVILGVISDTQVSYLLFEIMEVAVGVFLLLKSSKLALQVGKQP